MEASSPLAAMHRPSAPPFGRRNLFTNLHVRLSPGKPSRGVGRLGASGLSIRDQYNQESFGPVHGSSPAGSLAADLCQNFSIGEDGSPRFPTPRRALFTSCHAPSNNSTSSNKASSFLKRPPMPVPSSPPPIESLMEMTPVPKKAAPSRFSVPVAGIDISGFGSPSSPSPNPDMMMLESPCPGSQPRRLQQRDQEQQQEPQTQAKAQAQAQAQALAPPPTFEPPARPLSSASAFERRKLPRRASLTRAKGYSYAGAPARASSADSLQPLYKFGESRPPLTQTSSSLSISECFQDSPPQPAAASPAIDDAGSALFSAESRPQSSHSPCPNPSSGSGLHAPIRFRPPFASTSSSSSTSSSRSGSPIGHVRRPPSSSLARPRRQYRRSLSMFENPIDMMKPKRGDDNGGAASRGLQPSLLASVMDTDEPVSDGPALPHFFAEGQDDSIPRINRETLLNVLDGHYNDTFQNKLIIDCRFEYEYEGGHINEAINYNDKDLLARHLFSTPMDGRTLIVLHCEYSAHRAPLMARHLRAADRTANAEQYPHLTYPELYILDGGYSGFFTEHPCRCYPQAYVEMDAAEHASTCEREMGRLKQTRKGLHRAQTFAFGQHNESPSASHGNGDRNADRSIYEFNDVSSPIAPGRSISSAASPSMMIGASPILGCDRGLPRRRMVSY